MPAKPYLAARRKPPQFIMRIPVAGLRARRKRSQKDYFLQRLYAESRHLTSLEEGRPLQDSRERLSGECVYVKERNAHRLIVLVGAQIIADCARLVDFAGR
jgi:hypothetical protein